MIGMRPFNNPEFDKIFTWPDAVTEVPFTSDAIVSAIREFDKEPERQEATRLRTITECLLKHDWAYRWESVLNWVGMQPMPALEERKRILREKSGQVEDAFGRYQTVQK
jgi:hypothetical protein